MKNEKSNETTAQTNASTQTTVAEKPWDVMGITEAEYLDRETERLEKEMKAKMEPQVKVSDFPKQEGDPLETDGYHYVVEVTREGAEKDGKTYYNYSFYQKLFGNQSLRCDLVATLNDVGAYAMLSAMFEDVESIPLYARQNEIRDDVTGKLKSTYWTYELRRADEDGTIFGIEVKPQARSDMSVLRVALQRRHLM